MALSSDLISQFVKVTNDDTKESKETTVYGTTVEHNGSMYVKLDGSELLTPVATTTDTAAGERVTVMIKNHSATVTGNVSSPAARTDDVKEIGNKVAEFDIVIADRVTTDQLNAEKARIDELVAKNVVVEQKITASEADIHKIKTDNLEVEEKLTAVDAEINRIDAEKLDAVAASITYATIKNLEATDAKIYSLEVTYGDFAKLTADQLDAIEADIKNLDVEKLNAEQAELKFANIDFSNIGNAAIEYFYTKSGLIEDIIVGDGTITGNLVGVTIKGDLIEGGTVVADKLVIKGEDGLYYKLNTTGTSVEAEQTDYNSINGSIITAQSITASKISVDDLVAFDATIGGFNLTDGSLYSGVKETVDNSTSGVYLDSEGQIAFGDSVNFLRYYRTEAGLWRLEISAESIKLSGSNTSIATALGDLQNGVDDAKAGTDEAKNDIQYIIEDVSSLSVNSSSISAEVKRVEESTRETIDSLNEDISTLSSRVSATMTADEIAVKIQSEMLNGTNKVSTTTGITLDELGLTIDKTGSQTKTVLSDDGMKIQDSSSGDDVLIANHDGVDAKNLHATTYLIVGKNSRFEDYGDNRTGCFWIGG